MYFPLYLKQNVLVAVAVAIGSTAVYVDASASVIQVSVIRIYRYLSFYRLDLAQLISLHYSLRDIVRQIYLIMPALPRIEILLDIFHFSKSWMCITCNNLSIFLIA